MRYGRNLRLLVGLVAINAAALGFVAGTARGGADEVAPRGEIVIRPTGRKVRVVSIAGEAPVRATAASNQPAQGPVALVQLASAQGTSRPAVMSLAPTTAPRVYRASMDAGAAVLRPGVQGHEVDAAARASLIGAGYEEPMHALGHQLGRAVHDGGALLAPLWDRYGDSPRGLVEEGQVYTLEYGASIPGRGAMALEEDVLVTADGIEWLSTPQRELWLVG